MCYLLFMYQILFIYFTKILCSEQTSHRNSVISLIRTNSLFGTVYILNCIALFGLARVYCINYLPNIILLNRIFNYSVATLILFSHLWRNFQKDGRDYVSTIHIGFSRVQISNIVFLRVRDKYFVCFCLQQVHKVIKFQLMKMYILRYDVSFYISYLNQQLNNFAIGYKANYKRLSEIFDKYTVPLQINFGKMH